MLHLSFPVDFALDCAGLGRADRLDVAMEVPEMEREESERLMLNGSGIGDWLGIWIN